MHHIKFGIRLVDIGMTACWPSLSRLYLPIRVRRRKPLRRRFSNSRIMPAEPKAFGDRKKARMRKYHVSRYIIPSVPMLNYTKRYLRHPIRIDGIGYGSCQWVFDLTFYCLEDMIMFKVGFTPQSQ